MSEAIKDERLIEEISNMTEEDIINRLLEPTEVPEETYFVDRVGIPITLKGLSEKEIFKIKRSCTYSKKERGKSKEIFDEEEFNAALIEKATISPNWNDKKLLDGMKLSSGREVIRRKFLAGETSSMADKILELSGFDDELLKIEHIKN